MPHAGETLDAGDLLAFARANLADYKLPSEIIVRHQPFLRNAVGKIDKAALRASHLAEDEEVDADVVS